MSITIDTSELDRLSRDLRRAAVEVDADAEGHLATVSKITRASLGANFARQGAEFGSPWRSIAPSTRERKSREASASRPMVRTGALQRALSDGASEVKRGHSIELAVDRPARGSVNLAVIQHKRGRKLWNENTGIAGRGVDELDSAWEALADKSEARLS